MIGRRPTRNGDAPEAVLAILDRQATYDARLDEVLVYVSEMTALPDTHLYIAHEGGRHLHLARSRATAPAGGPSDLGLALLGDPLEGGTAWSVGTAPFELNLGEDEDRIRAVDSSIGRLLSLPLRTPGGKFVGVVHAGPLADSEPPKLAALRHAEMQATIATVVAAAVREEASRRRAELAETKLEATRRLAASALDVEQLVGLLLDLALSSTQTEAGFVAIADRTGGLRIVDQRGFDATALDELSLDPESGLFDWSLGDLGGGLMVRDVEKTAELGIRSLLAVPLIEGEERLGIFAVLNFSATETFGESSLDLLAAFADQIRLMLHNARTFGDFSERYVQTMVGLASSLDAGRPGYADHHQRVSAVGRTLASAIGMDAAEVEAIGIAGLIHDVGMAATAGAPRAFEADVQHPVVGASLVEHLPLHRSVANAVACHHEWIDGWGFPGGLEGRAIPRAGRVLAMAEFLVEMSTPDAVRPAWTPEHLADEVRQRRGAQFDPEIADLTVELIESQAPELLAARIGVIQPVPEDEDNGIHNRA